MTVLVVRLSGSYEEAGIFSLAYSVCNIFVIISNFSVRNYQIADIDDRFSKDEYVAFRLITCAVSLFILPIYLLTAGYSLYVFAATISFMLLKTGEALTDVFYGIFQKAWRLDIACKSFAVRGIVNLTVFSVSEYLFKNLVVSLLLSAVSSLVCALLIDVKSCFSMFEIKLNLKNKKLLMLCLCCLPMFFHGLLSTLIANIPRLSAERLLGEDMLGYYSSVAAPSMAVQLAASNIFTPLIPVMSEQFKNKDRKIYKNIFQIYLIVLAIGICAIIGFSLLGDWFLKLLFGEEILSYSGLLIPTIIVSIMTALVWFVSAIFTVINKNITMVVFEGLIALFTLFLSPVFIVHFGLQGINWTLIILYAAYILIGSYIVIFNIFKHFKNA